MISEPLFIQNKIVFFFYQIQTKNRRKKLQLDRQTLLYMYVSEVDGNQLKAPKDFSKKNKLQIAQWSGKLQQRWQFYGFHQKPSQ